MLKEGQKFGDKERYQLVKLLGRGGFSEVWLGDDTWTNVQVAIKVYAPGTGLDEDGIKLFTQEFSMVFDMNHTNLLKPTYFDHWERQPYLIMPLCKNGSAFKYVTGKERITEKQAWHLLHDVAAGLAYLHSKTPPVIHQDIKPDNILISDEGLYMITDFGISARVRSTFRGSGGASEQSGGTLAYMGPERFSATPKPIMASDVWSLGAMMYETMTAGTPPFGNHGGVLQKNGADIPIIEEDFSQELKDIVYSCLALNPWERPSAKAVEEMAYNHLHGINVGTVPLAKPEPEPQPVPTPQPEPAPKPAKPQQPQKTNGANGANGTHGANGTNGTNRANGANETNRPNLADSPQRPGLAGRLSILSKDTKIGIAIVVAALLLLAGFVAFCGGGDEDTVAEPTESTMPTVNLDSIAQDKLLMANDYAQRAAKHQSKYSEQLLNAEYGKIEEHYMDIIDKCREYETAANAAPGSTLADQSLGDRLTSLKSDAESQLVTIYQMLQQDIKELINIGSQESADLYQERANSILPYIEALLPTPEAVENPDSLEQTEQEQTEQ